MKQFLIIPLGGLGKRFVKEGYRIYKPFLKISNESSVIDNIINNFPKKTHLIIIGNQKRFNTIKKGIKKKNTTFIKIKNHNSGPVFSLFLAKDKISKIIKNKDFFISYSDINWNWNFQKVRKFIKNRKITIFSHIGFHPHLEIDARSDFFTTNKKKIVKKVSEKKLIKKDYKKNNLAIGCYYFKKFKFFENFFNSNDFNNNIKKKEIYIINLLDYCLKIKLEINFYSLNNFVHLGTPYQFEDFINWKKIIVNQFHKKLNLNFPSIMLMAGKGKRMKALKEKKPFLKINNQKIYEYILKKFGSKKKYIITNDNYLKKINKKYKLYKITKTNSMLQTIEKSLNFFKNKNNFFILSCDCFGYFESKKFKQFIKLKNPDIVLFSFKISKFQRLISNSHTTIRTIQNKIKSINVKKFSNNKNEFGHAGFFWIKNNGIFDHLENFHFKNRVNREILLDDYFKFLFDENLCKVSNFNLDQYTHLGSIKEYSEFKYWENYFKNEN